jgi:DNA-binding NarL/FixJ family response regulator
MSERNSLYQRTADGQVKLRDGKSPITRLNPSLHAVTGREEDNRSPAEHDFVVILIDPRPLTRRSVSDLIEHAMRGAQVVTVASPEELFGELAERGNDVGLIILNMAPEIEAEQLRKNIAAVQDALPAVPITIVADRSNTHDVVEALRQGVRGYIPTTLNPSVIIEALWLVRAGGTFVPANVFLQMITKPITQGVEPRATAPEPGTQEPFSGEFTPRQSSVLKLLRLGKPNKMIARELNMKESTVKAHIRQLLRKLGATNRTQAVIKAAKIDKVDCPN